MRISGRAVVGVVLIATVVGLSVSTSVQGQLKAKKNLLFQPGVPIQPALGDGPSTGSAAQFSAIRLEEKSEYRQRISLARDCIHEKNWTDAARALQAILDSKEDFYVQIREKDLNGRETLRWTSGKFEANNLLGTIPVEGLEVYELEQGVKARDLLDEARKKGDRELLGLIAQNYLHTRAGMEATDLLATLSLDRGQYFMATLRFEKLLAMNPERAKLTELSLFKAALAYRRAGDTKNADEIWRKLQPKLRENGGLKIGDDVIVEARLRQVLEDTSQPVLIHPQDWPLVRGNMTNSAQAFGSPAFLDEIKFKRRTILDLEEDGAEERGKAAKDAIDRAIARQVSLGNAPVMSGFFPIAAGRMVLYRSFLDVRAVYLYDGKDPQGNEAKLGRIAWRSTEFDGSLANVLDDNKLRVTLENWLTQYNNIPGFGTFVYENSLLGALSTDQRLVYAIDDLAVPAPPNLFPYLWNQQNTSQDVKPLVMQNSLCAFNLHTGKFEWRLGVSLFDYQKNPSSKEDPFADSHFLGVPLNVGGKLYVLNEKNDGASGDAELRLVCIDPNKLAGSGRPTVIDNPQKLGMVQQQFRFTHDISRRTNAVHLGYGEGILVCPTNAGEVLGVDLMSRSLAWSYPYREQSPVSVSMPNQPGFNPGFPGRVPQAGNMSIANWKSAPPVIQDGKVVFTAPDASSVHCVNLRDGTPVWKKRQMDGDLFLAGVHQGKVLVAGRNSLRALDLKDGSQVWYVSTGDLPSGQGVASKNIYYLPLKKGEILAVDIERGTIKAHNRAKTPDQSPGNLVFYEGMVLSQTPTEIVAYPQLVAKLELATKQVEEDPLNPERLVARGELLLADGQVQLAVNDLQNALKKNLLAPLKTRARAKLYEALTDLLQTDFNSASVKYLDEYEDLCKVPEDAKEQQLREARFFRIVGQGREAQGNLVDAFQMYRKFGSLPLNREQGVASIEDPMHKVPTNVWLRGRISGMMAKATAAQKLPLENKIAEEWRLVKAKKDLDAIRSFVDMFDIPFSVGREARLQLAETIMERNDRPAFLEAELNLQQLRGSDYFTDVSIAARALAGLARLEEKKGSAEAMKLAAAYYRELRRDYPTVPVRDGKTTGTDLFDELATDPRFLPYLEEQGPLWGNEKIAARDLQGISLPGLQGFIFQPEGDLTPLMKQHRLVLDPSNAGNPTLRLYNVGANNVRWTLNLGAVPINFQFFQYLYQQVQNNVSFHPNARFRFYQVKGNLAVFQVGAVAYCLDMDTARVLWQRNLVENMPNQPNVTVQQVQPDPDGNLEVVLWNQLNGQRTRLPIGHVGAVQASYVALATQKGLVVLDPLRGGELWRKMDVPASSRLFGDDQYLFLIEGTDGSGVGRAMRAIDGSAVEVPDFGAIYQNRIRIQGRRILASVPGRDHVTLRLYDIVGGKDLWTKTFDPRAVVLQTEDAGLCGVIEPNGTVTALDVDSGKVLFQNSIVQADVSLDDIKTLKDPLLLQDRDRYYLALNHPVDSAKVAGAVVGNNFGNGLRCMTVNGWVLAYYREDGQHKAAGKLKEHKKGEFAWHSSKKIDNQLVILEQFDNLPVMLFSSRHNEMINGGAAGNRWVSSTQSLSRSTGKLLYDPGTKASNSAPQFYVFNIDLKGGTINLIGYNGSVQHYVDDGRKPSIPSGGGIPPADPGSPPNPGIGLLPPNGLAPGMIRGPLIIRGGMQIQIAPALPPAPPPAPK